MQFFYLDEAGNTGNDLLNKDQPIHFISGISIHFNDIQTIEKEMKEIEKDYGEIAQKNQFEFHGTELATGKKNFKGISIEKRLETFKKIVDIFIKYDIKFFSQGIDKPALHRKNYTNTVHPHYLSFMYLIEKIDSHLEKNDKKGLIIMDKNGETEKNIILNFQDYKKNGTSFGYLKRTEITNILDNIYYTDSHNSHLMQLSDVIGYIYGAYRTSQYLGNIDKLGYMRKEILSHYESIIKKKIYIDIEPKN